MNAYYFDLGYTVVYTVTPHVIEFRAYKLLDAEAMTYQKEDSIVEPDPVHDITQAKWFAAGFIKFDGCINWEFNTDESYWHTCAGDDVKRMAELLVRIEETGRGIFDT